MCRLPNSFVTAVARSDTKLESSSLFFPSMRGSNRESQTVGNGNDLLCGQSQDRPATALSPYSHIAARRRRPCSPTRVLEGVSSACHARGQTRVFQTSWASDVSGRIENRRSRAPLCEAERTVLSTSTTVSWSAGSRCIRSEAPRSFAPARQCDQTRHQFP